MRRGDAAEQAVKTAANGPRPARGAKGRIKDEAQEIRSDFPAEPKKQELPPVPADEAKVAPTKRNPRGVLPDASGSEAERHAYDVMMSVVRILVNSGMTYEMAGHMFGVSKNTVRNWAHGRPIPAKNEGLIRRMHDAVHHIRRGSKGSTRAALTAVVPEFGKTRLDLLRERRYRDATKGIRKPRERMPGEQRKLERAPVPVEEAQSGPTKRNPRGVLPDSRGSEAERHAHDVMMSVWMIRINTDLTYEMLGHMFGVSRNTVRNWVRGRPIPVKNEDLIRRMHDSVLHIRRGSKGSTRAALTAVVPEFGKTRLELLRERRFRDATKGIRKPRRRRPEEERKGDQNPCHPHFGMNPGDGVRTFIDFELTPVHKRGKVWSEPIKFPSGKPVPVGTTWSVPIRLPKDKSGK